MQQTGRQTDRQTDRRTEPFLEVLGRSWKLECGTWYHHPRRLQCVLSRNLIIFKVATWHYRCHHNLKNNCIWYNLQCCLLVPRSPSRPKPVMLTFDLQSRKVLFIEIVFGMHNYDIGIYWRVIAPAICSRSQPLLNMNIERNFESTLWRHRWRHHHKKNFFLHNLRRYFHIWGQIETVFNISNFENGRHFELATNLFTESYSGSWIYQKDSY